MPCVISFFFFFFFLWWLRRRRLIGACDPTLSTHDLRGFQAEGGNTSFGVAEQDEWGVGKSRIWKALNPRPLAYQTAKERAEKEDKIDMGAVGNKNFSSMMNIQGDLHNDDLYEDGYTTGEHEVTSPTKIKGRNGTEVHNHDLDEDEHVRRPGLEVCIAFPCGLSRVNPQIKVPRGVELFLGAHVDWGLCLINCFLVGNLGSFF